MYSDDEGMKLENGGHNCIRDLKRENERLKAGLNQNAVTHVNMNTRSRLMQYQKFTFPFHLTEEDLVVQYREGVDDIFVLIIKKFVVGKFKDKANELSDVSSDLISILTQVYGGKWYGNVRACNLDNGNSL